MEESPLREADNCTAGQEIPCLSWNTNAHYRAQTKTRLIPSIRQFNPFLTPM